MDFWCGVIEFYNIFGLINYLVIFGVYSIFYICFVGDIYFEYNLID